MLFPLFILMENGGNSLFKTFVQENGIMIYNKKKFKRERKEQQKEQEQNGT